MKQFQVFYQNVMICAKDLLACLQDSSSVEWSPLKSFLQMQSFNMLIRNWKIWLKNFQMWLFSTWHLILWMERALTILYIVTIFIWKREAAEFWLVPFLITFHLWKWVHKYLIHFIFPKSRSFRLFFVKYLFNQVEIPVQSEHLLTKKPLWKMIYPQTITRFFFYSSF